MVQGGGPKARVKLQKWQVVFFFCGFLRFCFVDFLTLPPQVRVWITWLQMLAVGPGSKFFGAADPSFMCESTQAFER